MITVLRQLTILGVVEKPTAAHPVVGTVTLNLTLSPSLLTSQLNTNDGIAEGDQIPMH